MATLLFAALGAGLGTLVSSITPSLSTIAITSTGSLLLRWGLQKYVISSTGNYYYVYSLMNAPAALPSVPQSVQTVANVAGTTYTVGKFTVRTTGQAAYYSTMAAYHTAHLAARATWAAGTLLFVTVSSTGQVLCSVASQSTSLFDYVSLREPQFALEDFEEWEITTVDVPLGDAADDLELRQLATCWQLMERKDHELDQSLLDDEDEGEDEQREWGLSQASDRSWSVIEVWKPPPPSPTTKSDLLEQVTDPLEDFFLVEEEESVEGPLS